MDILKLNNTILVICFIFIFMSFSCTFEEKQINKIQFESKIGLEETKLWQLDSFGCNNIRSKELAEFIIDSLELENIDEVEFRNYFGSPNSRYENGSKTILIYYMESICMNGKYRYESDGCAVQFVFKDNKLIMRHYICS